MLTLKQEAYVLKLAAMSSAGSTPGSMEATSRLTRSASATCMRGLASLHKKTRRQQAQQATLASWRFQALQVVAGLSGDHVACHYYNTTASQHHTTFRAIWLNMHVLTANSNRTCASCEQPHERHQPLLRRRQPLSSALLQPQWRWRTGG
jgi:hypothetical protein